MRFFHLNEKRCLPSCYLIFLLYNLLLEYKQISQNHLFPVDCNMVMRLPFTQSQFFRLSSRSHTEMQKWICYNDWAFNLLGANSMSDGQELDHQKLSFAVSCIWLAFFHGFDTIFSTLNWLTCWLPWSPFSMLILFTIASCFCFSFSFFPFFLSASSHWVILVHDKVMKAMSWSHKQIDA